MSLPDQPPAASSPPNGAAAPALMTQGPDMADLRLDLEGLPSSPWNQEVIRLLVVAFKAMGDAEGTLPDEVARELISNKLLNLRKVWNTANSWMKSDGQEETQEDIHARLDKMRTETDKCKRRHR